MIGVLKHGKSNISAIYTWIFFKIRVTKDGDFQAILTIFFKICVPKHWCGQIGKTKKKNFRVFKHGHWKSLCFRKKFENQTFFFNLCVLYPEIFSFKVYNSEKHVRWHKLLGCNLWDKVLQNYAKNQWSKISRYCPFNHYESLTNLVIDTIEC